jgi:hypothetical protein
MRSGGMPMTSNREIESFDGGDSADEGGEDVFRPIGRVIRLTARNPWPSQAGKLWSWTCPECWHLIATRPTRDQAVTLVRLHVATHGRDWVVIDDRSKSVVPDAMGLDW